mmetsp:Transcript_27299/g.40349  ORF Transcript_27299/g.40349 Transcript_27299/m.40349 type:complete len:391 (+) Transcript_27299:110-1282(+)|eukprot:CAMPEP_0194100428 /NCGR_PEP_ID=MMETSP0150-20130528/1275_1 /TAXON_ID=122233 /ORGANISM="Chaetoceros debilis, Strain MM31A-1" /LENGTH=390 /DNA_ID=CAMNT_0038786783 /DNA_START=108 /DNA_END=1280 /DNA_ORIENTATION=+
MMMNRALLVTISCIFIGIASCEEGVQKVEVQQVEVQQSEIVAKAEVVEEVDECALIRSQLQEELNSSQADLHQATTVSIKIQNEYDIIVKLHQQCQEEKNRLTDGIESVQKQAEATEATLSTSRTEYQQCREEIANCLSDYNDSMQRLESLEEKKSMLHKNQMAKTKKLNEEIKSLERKLESAEKRHKSMQDRYHDERERVTDLDKDLRHMRHEAMKTYVNATLMKEDSFIFISKKMDKTIEFVEEIMAKRQVRDAKNIVLEQTTPAMKNVEMFYNDHVAQYISDLKKRLRDVTAVEATRLFLVSVVEQLGKTSLDYMELTALSPPRGTRRRAQKIFMRAMRYAKHNGEKVVNNSAFICFIYVVLKVIKFISLGALRKVTRRGESKVKQD